MISIRSFRFQDFQTPVVQYQQLYFGLGQFQHFPESTRLSRSQGGLIAWVELTEAVNTTDLYQRGCAQNLTIAPGEMFSASRHYKNCSRINFAQGWSPERVRAVQTIREWVQESL
jgi:DNA-binding transcriptional MocR family regulator